MKEGHVVFLEVCLAADPPATIAGLSAGDLERLRDFLAGCPDTGFPGVTKGQVTVDQARRWRAAQTERRREDS